MGDRICRYRCHYDATVGYTCLWGYCRVSCRTKTWLRNVGTASASWAESVADPSTVEKPSAANQLAALHRTWACSETDGSGLPFCINQSVNQLTNQPVSYYSQGRAKTEDTRDGKPAPIFDSENRRRFSTPIRTCSISRSIFGSMWSTETVLIGLSSLFSFGLFVNSAESVNKHFDYIFSYFCYDFQVYECTIAAATASSSSFSAMSVFRSRKSAPIFEVENRHRFSTPKIGAGFRPRVSSA